MYCTKCGAELIDGSNFCNKCGARQRVDEAEVIRQTNQQTQPNPSAQINQQVQPILTAQPVQQTQRNQYLGDTTYPEFEYSPNMGQPMKSQPNPWQSGAPVNNGFTSPYPSAMMDLPKKKNYKPKIIAAVTACILLIAAVILVIRLLPDKNHDVYTGTIEAFGKNLDSGGFKIKILANGTKSSARVKFDPKESELAFLAQSSDDEDTLGLYRGTFLRVGADDSVYETGNCSNELEIFFKYYKYLDGISKLSDIDWKKLYKQVDTDLKYYEYADEFKNELDVDLDTGKVDETVKSIKSQLKKFEAKLMDKKFMEDNFDYSMTKSDGKVTYEVSIHGDRFLQLLQEYFEEFREVADAYSLIGLDSVDLKIETTVEDGYLTEIVLIEDYEEDPEMVEITFSDFGSKKTDDMMEELKEYYDRKKDREYEMME